MSRSATPARFSAARTFSMRAAFWPIASLADTAWVVTPAEMVARSGTRLTSPVALISSRVPARDWITAGAGCAKAAAGNIIAPASAAGTANNLIITLSKNRQSRRAGRGGIACG